MRVPSRDDAGATRPADLNEADRILLLAERTFGGGAEVSDSDNATLVNDEFARKRLWKWLEPSWAQRLRDASARVPSSAGPGDGDPGSVRGRSRGLTEPRRASILLACIRVGGSAHSGRSPRRSGGSSPRQHPTRCGMRCRPGSCWTTMTCAVDRPADPEALAWVWSLWSERLVGGEPERADDPPVIVAMTGLSPRTGYHLCRLAGIIKRILAGQDEGDPSTTPVGRANGLVPGASRIHGAGVRSDRAARCPIQPGGESARRRRTAHLGLLTIARLLADCEPFRVRWALQHWPYTIAKPTRSLMPPDSKRSLVVTQVESLVLKTAWERLNLEGRSPRAGPR